MISWRPVPTVVAMAAPNDFVLGEWIKGLTAAKQTGVCRGAGTVSRFEL